MLKKVFFTCLAVVIIACTAPLAAVAAIPQQAAYAAGPINCTSSVTARFPLQLTFSLSAESTAKITGARLHYATTRETFVPAVSETVIDFTPDTGIDVSWSWDMRKTGGLPPGAGISYWWTLQDAAGNTAETEPAVFTFADDRSTWQDITEGNVTLYWYQGDESFTTDLMASAQDALGRLEEATGARLMRNAAIYIYGSTRDLQGAMIFPQEWTGGVAYTDYGIIALGIGPENLAWGVRSIAHELTHMVVHQMTYNPYSGLPAWLEEGLAMYAEGPLESRFVYYLQNAVSAEALIPVRTLSSPFSTDPDKALLSYAQSYSLVEYLVETYGQPEMLDLLTDFREGKGYEFALDAVYGLDMESLNAAWRDYASARYGSN